MYLFCILHSKRSTLEGTHHLEKTFSISQCMSRIFEDVEKETNLEKNDYLDITIEKMRGKKMMFDLSKEVLSMPLQNLINLYGIQRDVLMAIFGDIIARKQKRVLLLAKANTKDDFTRPSLERSKKKQRIIKKAKMKAKNRRIGFRSNIFFPNQCLKDNSVIKNINDNFMEEVKNSTMESQIMSKMTHDIDGDMCISTNCSSRIPSNGTSARLYPNDSNHGKITQCMESACNGNEYETVFECLASISILDKNEKIVKTQDNVCIHLTPKCVLIKTKDILRSYKITLHTIDEIRIDEMQEMLIINNEMRIFNFYVKSQLEYFLTILEYLIRNMGNSSSNAETIPNNYKNLMQPLSWSNVLNTKEEVLIVGINVSMKTTFYIAPGQDIEQNLNITSNKSFSKRGGNRIGARFKFYKCRNKSVMTCLDENSTDYEFGYFEVK